MGDREALCSPIDHTIFFAGEATHPAVNPCMQVILVSSPVVPFIFSCMSSMLQSV